MVIDTPTLLITDDDRSFRETLQSVFEPRGFHTVLAGDGEEALEIVQEERVHLALLDMHMPRLSGIETIQRFKQVQAILPCILISGDLDEPLAEQARQANVFSVHSKPISSREITSAVVAALQQTYDWKIAE